MITKIEIKASTEFGTLNIGWFWRTWEFLSVIGRDQEALQAVGSCDKPVGKT